MHTILLSILLIGTTQIYSFMDCSFILPCEFNLSSLEGERMIEGKIEKIGNIYITRELYLIIIFLSFFFLSIISLSKLALTYGNKNYNRFRTIEYELLMGFSLLGLILILISNDLILIYLGLEFFSFPIYLLLILNNSSLSSHFSLLYFLLSSFASGFIVLFILGIYYNTGTLNMMDLIDLYSNSVYRTLEFEGLSVHHISIFFLFSSLLYKLGFFPFTFWIFRLYSFIHPLILLFVFTLPKFTLLLLFLKFSYLFPLNSFYILLLFSIITILIGSIGGLFFDSYQRIITYSSIFNIGFIFFVLSLFFLNIMGGHNPNGLGESLDLGSIWPILHFLFVYLINLLPFFFFFFLSFNSINNTNFTVNNYYLYSTLIISLLSFIGFPPFGGFFSKFYIFPFLLDSSFYFFNVSLFIISSLLSAIFYTKLIYLHFPNYPFHKVEDKEIEIQDNISIYILLSFFVSFLLFYSYFFPFLYPFFFF